MPAHRSLIALLLAGAAFNSASAEALPCMVGIGLGANLDNHTYTATVTEVICPEVQIDSNGYYGVGSGYCETYIFDVAEGQLRYSSCQAVPTNHKPVPALTS